jgi:hypothetical protein
MRTKKSKAVINIGSAQLQSHAYPSRQEIITKCESGSFNPILKNKGRGATLADMKESNRKFKANYDLAFGKAV